MNKAYLVGLCWLFAGYFFWKLAAVWRQLPANVAIHFDSALRPNDWSSRKTMSTLFSVVVLLQAAGATWLLLDSGIRGWLGTLIVLLVSAIVPLVFAEALSFNVDRKYQGRLRVSWTLASTAIALAVCVGIAVWKAVFA